MTDDLAALVDHLKSGPVNVLGWSDGGIEALLLGIRHPAKVKKIAAMAPTSIPGRRPSPRSPPDDQGDEAAIARPSERRPRAGAS